MLPRVGVSPGQGLVSFVRALLLALWGLHETVDPPPRVLIER
jgi:hypothetical protein